MIYADTSKHDDANIRMWEQQNKSTPPKKPRKKRLPQVQVTEREIEAMKEIVSMYIGDEKTHCELNHFENYGTESEEDWDAGNQEDGDHIYYDLKILEGLINRIKKINL